MENVMDAGDLNDESIISDDRGYASFDIEHQSASGISAQLAPEFSRKLSFVEHTDEPDAAGGKNISDSSLGAVFCDNNVEKSNTQMKDIADTNETAAKEFKQSFVCPCGESFEKSVQLAAHKRWSCKLKERTAQCDVCKNWFASDMGLKRHMKHAHGGVYSCENCSLRFPNKIKLTRHWMEAHYDDTKEKSKVLKCYECGDTNFDNKFELECHLVLHKFEKHQQKLAQGDSTSHHSNIHFTPYPTPPFMRPMRPNHPFHHPYGFGPPWSHFPFRPPPPMFPFMPFSSFGPFRPPFQPPPPPFSADTSTCSSAQDDSSSMKSSFRESASFGTSTATADDCSSAGAAGSKPHHNHEYVESTAFSYMFQPHYDCKHHRYHHHHKHFDLNGKKKWKKYLKLMMKGKVPDLLSRLGPVQDLNTSHSAPRSQENQGSSGEQNQNADTCEFKIACKFCDKVIEKNNVSWHQKKECPVLAAHRCGVCDRVFKKRHFLIRHMHEQNHFNTNGSVPPQNNANTSFSTLQETMNASLEQLKFSEDATEAEENKTASHVTAEMQASFVRSVSVKTCDVDLDQEFRMAAGSSRCSDVGSTEHLRCKTCRHFCQSVEKLSDHLKEHISQVLAVQKVREWTSKSSEYFFLRDDDNDEDELESESVSTATTSYFDSEITSTASSTVPDIGSNFSSLETTMYKDPKWTKPHKKRSKNHHKGEINICEFCGEKFAFRKDLHYHMETAHKDSTLECPVCKKKFSWKKRGKFYERHLNSHFGVKIFKHKCDACGKTFLENSKLRAHMSLHNSDLLHKCTVCGKGYANKSSLVRHERKHTGVKPYQCDICKETFMEKRELLRHSTMHTGVAPFSCLECGQGFTLKTSLMSHMKKKHSKKEKLSQS